MTLDYEKVQILMAEKLLNQADLTKLSELSAYGLHKVLSGKTRPTPKTIGKIARALEVKVEQILKTD